MHTENNVRELLVEFDTKLNGICPSSGTASIRLSAAREAIRNLCQSLETPSKDPFTLKQQLTDFRDHYIPLFRTISEIV